MHEHCWSIYDERKQYTSSAILKTSHVIHLSQMKFVQWALVYPTTFVPHKVCQINQVLDKSG